jgi:hypothetical protein
MSKKNKKYFQEIGHVKQSGLTQQAEHAIIKHDLIKVIILNGIYLAGLLVLYYSNLRTHYLERWFEKILHF